MSMIDDIEVENTTAAELEDAPFPESTRIPTAHVSLEDPDGKPNAFGTDATAAPDDVDDATIEAPSGGDIPVSYEEAAKALGSNDAGNEFGNSSMSGNQKPAKSTNAETLTKPEAEGDGDGEPEPKKAVRSGGVRRGGGMKPAAAADK